MTLIAFAIVTSVTAKRSPRVPVYEIRLDEARLNIAEMRLSDPPHALVLARKGAAEAIAGLSCGNRPLAVVGDHFVVPRDCPVRAWRIALTDGARGVDASLPTSAWIPTSRFWFLAERHGFLRTAGAGRVRIVARWRDGRRTVRTLAFPRADEPPFYAVIGARPIPIHRAAGFALPIWDSPPDIAGLAALNGQIVAALRRLWRNVVPLGQAAPTTLDLAWLPRPTGIAPRYAASAGASAIGA